MIPTPFDPTLLFDVSSHDQILYEQLHALIREGYTGSDLIHLIIRAPKEGISAHISRLMSLITDMVAEKSVG